MERIIFRAVIVLSVTAFIVGSFMLYIGNVNADVNQQLWNEEFKKFESPEQTKCWDEAIRTRDKELSKICSSDMEKISKSLDELTSRRNDGYSLRIRGFYLAVLVPSISFALFFIFRWILTGRWKALKPEGS
jgi:hypothetical protein